MKGGRRKQNIKNDERKRQCQWEGGEGGLENMKREARMEGEKGGRR